MKVKFFYIVIVFGWITSCELEQETVPNIIERDKMVEVISEIELTQALIKLKFSNKDTINSQALYHQVYEAFNISEEEFNNSLVFYCKTPKEAEGIYTEAIALLSAKQPQKK
jgi:hypothetical protein